MYEVAKSTAKKFAFAYNGKAYEVPARGSLPIMTFRAIRKAMADAENSEEAFFDEVMKLFDEHAPEVMESIDLDQAMELFRAYATDGDEPTLGESSASSD